MKMITRFFSISMAVLLAVCIGLQNQPVRALESSISAQQVSPVISGNAGVPGATLSYTDGTPQTATADGAGNYSFSVTSGFAGTVTPSKTGYTVVFTPASIDYSSTPVTSDQTNQDYTPDTSWWTVSGAAGVAGATISYNDGSPESVVADGSGNYSLLVPDNFASTITPSLAGYTFSPLSYDYSSAPVLADLPNQDFTPTAITYTISGNAGVAGVTLSYTDGSPLTATSDVNGDYTFTVSYNWAGTVTPSLAGYTFSPASRDYSSTPVLSDQPNQDFTPTAITYTISGNAGVAGATLSYTDGSPQTATADSNGDYTFNVSYNWSGTVTPSYWTSTTAYSFSPVYNSYVNVLADQSAQNYTATSHTLIATLFAPSGTITDPTPTYKWSRIPDATKYSYELLKSGVLVYTKTFSATTCPTGPCTFTPATVLADGSYKWRLRVMANGVWKAYSAYKLFTILTVPTPMVPSGISINTKPTYKWAKINGATQYEIQLYNGATFVYSKIVLPSCVGTVCSNTPTTVLPITTAYKWRVRAKISGGIWRSFSAYKSFGVVPLLNGNFESGPTDWSQYSTHGWQLITSSFPGTIFPHAGSFAVWLGGDDDDVSYVKQLVYVPATLPYLSYWYWIASQDACGYDFGGVLVNTTVVDSYTLCYSVNTGGWARRSINLSAYAGQYVYLQMRVETDSSYNSNLFIDDVTFQTSAASVQSAPIGNPSLAAATMQGKKGILPQGDIPEGLVPNRIFSPLTAPK